MIADSNSRIAWQALEIARFRTGDTAHRAIVALKRKIAESERCIAVHDNRTRRPLATDLRSLAQVRWAVWNANAITQQKQSRAYLR
jgi:hypothetical protein